MRPPSLPSSQSNSRAGAIPPIAEQQAMLWALLLLDKVPIPTSEPHYRLLASKTARIQYGVDHSSYMSTLAKDMGAAPGLWELYSEHGLQVLASYWYVRRSRPSRTSLILAPQPRRCLRLVLSPLGTVREPGDGRDCDDRDLGDHHASRSDWEPVHGHRTFLLSLQARTKLIRRADPDDVLWSAERDGLGGGDAVDRGGEAGNERWRDEDGEAGVERVWAVLRVCLPSKPTFVQHAVEGPPVQRAGTWDRSDAIARADIKR